MAENDNATEKKERHMVNVLMDEELREQLRIMSKQTKLNLSGTGKSLFEVIHDNYIQGKATPKETVQKMLRAAEESPIPVRPGATLLPMLGYIGLANDFDVTPEYDVFVQVPPHINVPNAKCYSLIGIGESMTGSDPRSIRSGSHCLFEPNSTPEPRNIVHLEWQNGEKCSVKEFRGLDSKTDEYVFMPLNESFEPLRIKRGEVEVKGKLIIDWVPRVTSS